MGGGKGVSLPFSRPIPCPEKVVCPYFIQSSISFHSRQKMVVMATHPASKACSTASGSMTKILARRNPFLTGHRPDENNDE
jgi:hypothetical protein